MTTQCFSRTVLLTTSMLTPSTPQNHVMMLWNISWGKDLHIDDYAYYLSKYVLIKIYLLCLHKVQINVSPFIRYLHTITMILLTTPSLSRSITRHKIKIVFLCIHMKNVVPYLHDYYLIYHNVMQSQATPLKVFVPISTSASVLSESKGLKLLV